MLIYNFEETYKIKPEKFEETEQYKENVEMPILIVGNRKFSNNTEGL